jgi:hypothetical protein
MSDKERITISLDEWYEDYALEVELADEEIFLSIVETLTRIGVSTRDNKLYQSCHILHKRGKYYIVHFKELFALDGRPVDITDDDIKRRNTIASLIEEWGMIDIIDHDYVENNKLPVSAIKIIKYSEKPEYELIAKYQIGSKRK